MLVMCIDQPRSKTWAGRDASRVLRRGRSCDAFSAQRETGGARLRQMWVMARGAVGSADAAVLRRRRARGDVGGLRKQRPAG